MPIRGKSPQGVHLVSCRTKASHLLGMYQHREAPRMVVLLVVSVQTKVSTHTHTLLLARARRRYRAASARWCSDISCMKCFTASLGGCWAGRERAFKTCTQSCSQVAAATSTVWLFFSGRDSEASTLGGNPYGVRPSSRALASTCMWPSS